MKSMLLPCFLFLFSFPLFSQVPQAFTYQAIARDADGKPLADGAVQVMVKILQNGNVVYTESTNLTTNDFGLFTLQVGTANPGNFSSIDWANGDYLLNVQVSGAVNIETTTTILSVPYALLADEVVHEKQTLNLNGNQLSIEGGNTVTLPTGTTYTAGSGISINGNQISTTDLDSNPNNEIQSLDLAGNTLSLSNGGGSVTLPTGTTYTEGTGIDITGGIISNIGDLSNTNEIQSLNLAGNTLSLSNGGGSVTLPTGTTYTEGTGIDITGGIISNTGDLSNTNEIQSLNLAGNTLTLSDGGGSVTLPTATNYTEGTGIDITGGIISNAGDLSNTNEIQQLSLNGSQLSLSNGGNAVTLPTGTTYTAGSGIAINGNAISATDNSVTNEIQQLAYNSNNNQLSISGTGGNSVTLPGLQWQNTAGGIYFDAGKVGVGTNNLTSCCQNFIVKGGAVVRDQGENERWHITTYPDGSVFSQTKEANGQVRIEQGISAANNAYISTSIGQAIAQMETAANGSSYFHIRDNQDAVRADIGYLASTGMSYLNLYGPGQLGGVRAENFAGGDSRVIIRDPANKIVAKMGQDALGNYVITSVDEQTDDVGMASDINGSRGVFIKDDNDRLRMQATLNTNDVEFLMLSGSNGNPRVILAPFAFGANNGGAITVADANGQPRVGIASFEGAGHASFINVNDSTTVEISAHGSDGQIIVSGSNGNQRAYLGTQDIAAGNGGSVKVYNTEGNERGNIFSGTEGEGHFTLFNHDHFFPGNNSIGVEIFAEGPSMKPRARLYNNNTIAASMYVDATGKGNLYLSGDVNVDGNLAATNLKTFVIPHPTQPEKELVYACIEGPEAAVYLRGTATLVNGEAVVKFPEEFTLVANAKGMTIQMTPQSADSKGLAAVERSGEGFRVKELHNGTGSYEFDWEVKAVRKGFENFEVVRDKRKTDRHAE